MEDLFSGKPGNQKRRRSSLLPKQEAERICESFAAKEYVKSEYESQLEQEITDWKNLLYTMIKENKAEQLACDESSLKTQQKEYINKGVGLINEYLSGVEQFNKSLRYYHEKRFYLEELKMQIYQESSDLLDTEITDCLAVKFEETSE